MKRILHHINKHHKKYIFGAGIAAGLGIIKIITVIAVFLGVSIMTGKGSASGVEEQSLLLFSQIEEIAHKRDILLHKIGKEKFAIREANFHKIEEAFHTEDDLIGKFKLAQKLDSLVHRQAGFTEIQKHVTPAEIEKFQQLEEKFDSLYNHEYSINRTDKSETFRQEAGMIFNKLYDIAKKRDAVIHALNKDNFLAWEISYHAYASTFENTEDVEERYQLSKTISNLLYWQDEYLIEKGYIGIPEYITEEEETEYKQTQIEFENLHDK